MTWEFEITGDPWVLGQLSEALQSEDIKIVKQNGLFKLVGRVFDGIDSNDKARKTAEEQLGRISGLAFLNLQLKAPLQVKSVASLDDEGHAKSCFITSPAATIDTYLSLVVTDPQGNVISRSPSPDSIHASLNLAGSDKNVDKVLRLLGSGDFGWVNLYRIYEVVAADAGGEHALEKKRWVDPKDLDLFHHTANSPQAAGDSARHGKPAGSPPRQPMSLSEAQALIRTLAQKWLQEKT